MKTSMEFLPAHKQNELNQIIELLKEKYSKLIEAVVLFGSYARGTWIEDKYVEDGTTYEYNSDFDLLVVLRSERKARNTDVVLNIRRTVKKHLDIDTPISMIFHGYDYVTSKLIENHYFFADIYYEGVILYNKRDITFREPQEVDYKVRIEKSNEHMEEWYNSACEFIENFEFNYNKKGYKLASFMLHQAAERFYQTINLVFVDYKPKTHDLEELSAMAIEENSKVRHVFPRDTQEDEDMFQLLRRAYIDSRYDKNFKITKEELEYLVERVEKLKKITNEICLEKIEQFKELSKLNPDDQRKYEAKQRAVQGKKESIEEVENQRKLVDVAEVVQNMHKNGLSLKQISEFTNIAEDEVEKLLEQYI